VAREGRVGGRTAAASGRRWGIAPGRVGRAQGGCAHRERKGGERGEIEEGELTTGLDGR
jgi:hypothetical protein